MKYNQVLECREDSREFHYLLMRFARTGFYLLMAVGMIIFCIGAVYFLWGSLALAYDVFAGQQYSEWPDIGTLQALGMTVGAMLVFFTGITLFSIGVSAITGYPYDTYMPTTFVRVCPKCGEPLTKDNMNYFCPNKKCRIFLPMGVKVLVFRWLSRFVTIWNIAYIIIGWAIIL
ncbi:MAG TPA: hypothetical protein DCL44_11440 [Elusimicrobia bacterium]|nr:hypothetical protein [Elusimicrobiota bacterium]